MDCPVCGATAEDITPHTFDGKSVRCPTCGDYDISGSVWDPGKFQLLDSEQRLDALNKVKRFAQPDKRPIILTYYYV